jgi:isocitrate dehydrogenase
VQGHPVDLGGYYLPDAALASAAMRPSPTLNAALADFAADVTGAV